MQKPWNNQEYICTISYNNKTVPKFFWRRMSCFYILVLQNSAIGTLASYTEEKKALSIQEIRHLHHKRRKKKTIAKMDAIYCMELPVFLITNISSRSENYQLQSYSMTMREIHSRSPFTFISINTRDDAICTYEFLCTR